MGPSASPIPILLVDDDRIHSRLLQARLQREGYAVTMAASGQEGLELARRHQPVVVLCDWLMDGMDGVEVCRAFRDDPALASTYFILLTSRSRVEDRVLGLDSGADDFLSKPVDQEELLARVRSGVRLYQANERLRYLADELQRQKSRLDAELAEASAYVSSLLPDAIEDPVESGVTVESRFVPSHELGGDVFDYFWIDDDHLALYLADASGHGLAAAFPSISVHNVLRSSSLGVDRRQPAAVLQSLNASFGMERQQGRYLTMWYGVYAHGRRTLRYASAGHPPALLWSPQTDRPLSQLSGHGLALGLFEDSSYVTTSVPLNGPCSLLLYSDGIYEVPQMDGTMWTLPGFISLVEQCRPLLQEQNGLDRLVQQVCQCTGGEGFLDDYALVQADFPAGQS
ncbi:MAG: PP2C family protein-serine/threonine phosphatase [Cyanobium sp. Prado107]|jgi:sigma-B regulation protein RsbU (phosphoserine phosphatase)|nr:PP2C family protein-serine/threonine phosphatase [Cyanobium sp. Prado107]